MHGKKKMSLLPLKGRCPCIWCIAILMVLFHRIRFHFKWVDCIMCPLSPLMTHTNSSHVWLSIKEGLSGCTQLYSYRINQNVQNILCYTNEKCEHIFNLLWKCVGGGCLLEMAFKCLDGGKRLQSVLVLNSKCMCVVYLPAYITLFKCIPKITVG